MQYLRKVASILLPALMLALAGCGGDSSGSAENDPFSNTPASSAAQPAAATPANATTPVAVSTPVTAQDPDVTLTLKTDLVLPTLLTELPQIDVNIGTVLLSAVVLNTSGGVLVDPTGTPIGAGAPIPNQEVLFTILAGPGSIGYQTPATDKNGVANALFTTGDVDYTTNVIIEAITTVGAKDYRAYASFQIVRGTGVISIGDDGTLPSFDATIDPNLASGEVFKQQIVFKLTDSNGNPRVNAPVTLSLYSQHGDATVVIDYLKTPENELNQQTVTTDSGGRGIFNVSVTMNAPVPGLTWSESIVFKAVTNDAIPIVAYVGGVYSLTSKLPGLSISPSNASFVADEITFNISGGVGPYSIASSDPGRATATLLPDGKTAIAHLIDATQWAGAVTITVTDRASQTASATLSR